MPRLRQWIVDFSTNWAIMKSTQALENEIDLCLYNIQPVLHVWVADFWVCVAMCIWVSELCIFYTVCSLSSDNPMKMHIFVSVYVLLLHLETGKSYENWVWQKLSVVISVTIWQHVGTGPSTPGLHDSTLAVNHVCFSSFHLNILM